MFKSESPAAAVNRPLHAAKGLLTVACFFGGAFGVFFFIWKGNFSASSACLELEITCVLLLHLTNAVVKGTVQERYTAPRLKAVFIVAVVLGVASLMGCLGYAALGALQKQDFRVEGRSYYVAIIPSALCCLLSTVLAVESRAHLNTFAIAGPATTMGQFPSGAV